MGGSTGRRLGSGAARALHLAGAIAGLLLAQVSAAQAADQSDEELAKKLSNPISSLISVPFQNNVDCCLGDDNAVKYTLNFQPVVPVAITPDINLIVRTIVPVLYESATQTGANDHFGVGDITQSFFFSPSKSGGLIWGVGPVFLWPAGGSFFGSQKWSIGPTFVVLHQAGPWTVGMLANQLWSYAGDSRRPRVNAAFLQPFLAYTYRDSTTISFNTETTLDWKHDVWSVPINMAVSHVYRLGEQRVQLQLGARYYVVSPQGGARIGSRLTATFLFPK